jgi:hypothetical protein
MMMKMRPFDVLDTPKILVSSSWIISAVEKEVGPGCLVFLVALGQPKATVVPTLQELGVFENN